ncbi:MAG: RNA-binding domain-containing protein [Candidatus Margulisiibacteriota bacterium]
MLNNSAENEIVEFKRAEKNFDFNKIGKYFSALANEARLQDVKEAWLIFGINDETKTIIGTNYRHDYTSLMKLKKEIADKISGRLTFIDIYVLKLSLGRVIMFRIPAAPKGIPIAWDGHFYGRDGESLSPLNLEEIERIRNYHIESDWSAVICKNATLEDLEPKAIAKARENYKNKFPDLALEVDDWDDITFLNKAKITIKDKITRTAIILLGRSESEHFITPSEAKIRWILKDQNGYEKDYKIFTCPFLLAVDEVYNQIRNLTYRYLKEGTLFPDEVLQYDPYNIREILHNCIAHQDYTKKGRINVIEMDDQLLFTNLGTFIPGTIENVIKENAPEMRYRNNFLVTAMFNMKMVDTIGSGIRRMFMLQQKRFFPLPDYNLGKDRVEVTLIGKVINSDYARVLASQHDLSLDDVICLDKIQKKYKITQKEISHLKRLGLIEGRKPNFHISLSVAKATGDTSEYIKQKGIDTDYCKKIILDYLKKFDNGKKHDFEKILLAKLPDVLTYTQKQNKIKNIFQSLKNEGLIMPEGKTWKMYKNN